MRMQVSGICVLTSDLKLLQHAYTLLQSLVYVDALEKRSNAGAA